MKFSVIEIVSLLTAVVHASDPMTPQQLRVVAVNSTGRTYEGFYMSTYHEGAGFADATIVYNASQALPGAFLNATSNVTLNHYYLNFNVSLGGYYYPAQLTTKGYDTLGLMTINSAGAPSPGFDFNADGKLTWQNATTFAACDFIHAPGYPSVYFQQPYYIGREPLPSVCTAIEFQRQDQYLAAQNSTQ